MKMRLLKNSNVPTCVKQISFEIPEEWHKDIKMRALNNNTSVKEWILEAISDKVCSERALGVEKNVDMYLSHKNSRRGNDI